MSLDQGAGTMSHRNGAVATRDLVRAAQHGDRHATEQLVNRHASLVWSTVRSFSLRAVDADDAVQGTWLRMIEHLGELRSADCPETPFAR
jgi:DNA-directed RNA polymerase specialized sigma24 family protein